MTNKTNAYNAQTVTIYGKAVALTAGGTTGTNESMSCGSPGGGTGKKCL